MDQNILIALIAIVAILVVIGVWATMRRRQTDHLRGRFGDEYDRTLDAKGGRADAEADLREREERVDALDIRPLRESEHRKFAEEWREVKAVFVDSPTEAVLHADRMLATMMKTKGFPMADFDRRYEDLTVNHGDVARHYREGHAIADRHSTGEVRTEDMRQAMKHYEALYDRLVSDADGDVLPAHSGSTATVADTTGDGRSDTVFKDLDGDGDADIAKQDIDGDGRTERVRTT